MSVETIVNLSKINNILALKEASGNLDTMAEIISKTHSDLDHF
jgi:4-hydroxy-tetrahydrodipicolinate synthase